MTNETILCCLIPMAYLAGSIPFGLIVGKAKGIDPRTAGSGNIGATNVGRLLGFKFFLLVFLLDLLKGLTPMLVASYVLGGIAPADRTASQNLLHLLIGFAAIAGHMFSIFLGFKGGKGVATSAGVALGLYPFFTLAGLVGLLIWGVIFGISRYVSLASMIAALAFPLAFIVIGQYAGWNVFAPAQLPLLIFASLVAVMIVVRHRSNISRLMAGTESRFVGKKA
jgi:glycerol-3-phosphate acyltransferase PlsY